MPVTFTKDDFQAHPLQQLDLLLGTWEKLGEGERNTLMTFLMRLYRGQRQHGKITRTKKDWTYEALEEALDGCVYLACALEGQSYKAFKAAMGEAEAEVSQVQDWIPDSDTVPDTIPEALGDSCTDA